MKIQIAREAFLTAAFTTLDGEEAYTLHHRRRDGNWLSSGWSREALDKLLRKYFPGAGRKTKTRAGQRRRTIERKNARR